MGGGREGKGKGGMGGGREGKGREGKGGGSSLRARSLAAGIGGRVGWGWAVRDLARRLDPERILLLSTIFFSLAFLRFLTKISIFREGRVHVRKERKMTWVKSEQN